MTFSVTLCVRSLTFGAMMVFSEEGGEDGRFSLLVSEKLSVMSGILLMVLYLVRFESDVEPRRLHLIWLNGPVRGHTHTHACAHTLVISSLRGTEMPFNTQKHSTNMNNTPSQRTHYSSWGINKLLYIYKEQKNKQTQQTEGVMLIDYNTNRESSSHTPSRPTARY